jgi:MFS family permease
MRGVGDTATVTGPAGIRAYGRDLAAGLRFLRGERLICGIMLMAAASNLLDQGYSEVMQPVWARQVVGSAGALGLMTGVFGLGSVVGNLIGAWLGPRLPRRLTYGLGYMLGGVTPFLTLAFVHSLVPVLALFFVAAVLGGPINSVIGATLYERIPEAMRARVLGVVRASAWIGIPFGALIGGYVTQASGVIHALVAFGTVYFVITLATFVFPTWRQLRRPPPPAIPTQHPANPDAVLAT